MTHAIVTSVLMHSRLMQSSTYICEHKRNAVLCNHTHLFSMQGQSTYTHTTEWMKETQNRHLSFLHGETTYNPTRMDEGDAVHIAILIFSPCRDDRPTHNRMHERDAVMYTFLSFNFSKGRSTYTQ